jgi:hypothetical protein
VHYDPDAKSLLVMTQASIFIAFTILMMRTDFRARVIDVKGAFLKGKLNTKNEVLMLKVPQGFCWIYDRLGYEMESRKQAGNAMTKSKTVDRAKEIFKEWLEKDVGRKQE